MADPAIARPRRQRRLALTVDGLLTGRVVRSDLAYWSKDQQWLAFNRWGRDKDDGIYLQRADGGGTPKSIIKASSAEEIVWITDWSSDITGVEILEPGRENLQSILFLDTDYKWTRVAVLSSLWSGAEKLLDQIKPDSVDSTNVAKIVTDGLGCPCYVLPQPARSLL
jgi:hypothetical protein